MRKEALIQAAAWLGAAVCAFTSCSDRQAPSSSAPGSAKAGPPCIIYKTRADYSMQVPVELSTDKARLVSYPDIRDVYRDGKPMYPTPLADGFLLDNRGIGPGVAFLKLTYEQYHSLARTPEPADLFNQLLDRDPLTEMYRCGTRYQYKDPVTELNAIITGGKLKDCEKLK